jgi:hypothetical protein
MIATFWLRYLNATYTATCCLLGLVTLPTIALWNLDGREDFKRRNYYREESRRARKADGCMVASGETEPKDIEVN